MMTHPNEFFLWGEDGFECRAAIAIGGFGPKSKAGAGGFFAIGVRLPVPLEACVINGLPRTAKRLARGFLEPCPRLKAAGLGLGFVSDVACSKKKR